jgi:hypothetical protein
MLVSDGTDILLFNRHDGLNVEIISEHIPLLFGQKQTTATLRLQCMHSVGRTRNRATPGLRYPLEFGTDGQNLKSRRLNLKAGGGYTTGCIHPILEDRGTSRRNRNDSRDAASQ